MPEPKAALTPADVDRLALGIPCPACRANTGSRCTTGGYGYRALSRPHVARRNAAKEQAHA